ncbi:MAG TPA: tetratricopeptide repeat protein [Candidatus Polarisedimenticolia bacterium]|nr:tetratricopeptide repeat protein [Candidatus Polarisedimenticolia bacterium]
MIESTRPRLRSAGAILGWVLACFVLAAVLQPAWSLAAGPYADALAAISRLILPRVEPAPVFGGFERSGTILQVTSALLPGRSLGGVETRHFSFYLPFVVLLLVVARWRLRLVSGAEILVLLGFLFAVQVTCVTLGALRVVVFALVPGGGFSLMGPLEYDTMHTLYHVYGNFGPELWNGVIVGFVLLRAARLSDRPPVPAPPPPATSRALVAACAVLILPACAYMTAAPAVRRYTGESRRAGLIVAKEYARIGNLPMAARVAHQLLDANGQDPWAMILMGSLEENSRPEQAAGWYEKVLAAYPQQVNALMGLARARTNLGDGPGAESLYYQVLNLEPRNFEAYESLGDIAMARGDYPSARATYDLAIRFGPERAATFLKIGRAHQLSGDPCAAEGFYAKSLALDSTSGQRSRAGALVREVSALCPRAAR